MARHRGFLGSRRRLRRALRAAPERPLDVAVALHRLARDERGEKRGRGRALRAAQELWARAAKCQARLGPQECANCVGASARLALDSRALDPRVTALLAGRASGRGFHAEELAALCASYARQRRAQELVLRAEPRRPARARRGLSGVDNPRTS